MSWLLKIKYFLSAGVALSLKASLSNVRAPEQTVDKDRIFRKRPVSHSEVALTGLYCSSLQLSKSGLDLTTAHQSVSKGLCYSIYYVIVVDTALRNSLFTSN